MDPLFWIAALKDLILGSMQKGSQWERDCAKKISLWLSSGERDDLVWRTASSGGRFTIRNKKNKQTCNQAGDLCATDPSVQYFFDRILIECKNGYKKQKTKKNSTTVISVLHTIDKTHGTNGGLLLKWWLKAKQECEDSDREYPIIIFKRTKQKPCLLLEKQLILKLSAYNGRYQHNMILMKLIDYPILVICDLEKWLDWCSPQSIETLKTV